MSTAAPSLLTSDESKLLESLLFCATEQELSRLNELLAPTVTATLPTATENRTATPDEWQALIAENLRKYCPHEPWPKQRFLLDLDCREIMFGGAKGPGKTDVLLMAALRYVHVPGYACLLLRRTTKEAKKANSILTRLRAWTAKTDASWNMTDGTVTFPSGAIFTFGYIDNPLDAFQFQSSEYATIIFDELTDFRIFDNEGNLYTFMFGMNRKGTVNVHPWLNQVPKQIISGTNPGGKCHLYVKNRFLTPESIAWVDERVKQRAADKQKGVETIEPPPRAFYSGYDKTGKPVRAFVPALIYDNPAIDAEEYIEQNLNHMPEIMRARYVNGDWTVQAFGLIQPGQFREYDMNGDYVRPLRLDGTIIDLVDQRHMTRFATVDTAGTSEQKAAEAKGKPPSWSVCTVWDWDYEHKFLFLKYVWRGYVGFIDLCDNIERVAKEWRVPLTLAEDAYLGNAVIETLKSRINIAGTPVITSDMKGKGSGTPGKVTRATPLFRMLAAGQIFFPKHESGEWLHNYKAELLAWTGLPDESNDQVDCTSYACNYAESLGGMNQGEQVYYGGIGRVDYQGRDRATIGGWR